MPAGLHCKWRPVAPVGGNWQGFCCLCSLAGAVPGAVTVLCGAWGRWARSQWPFAAAGTSALTRVQLSLCGFILPFWGDIKPASPPWRDKLPASTRQWGTSSLLTSADSRYRWPRSQLILLKPLLSQIPTPASKMKAALWKKKGKCHGFTVLSATPGGTHERVAWAMVRAKTLPPALNLLTRDKPALRAATWVFWQEASLYRARRVMSHQFAEPLARVRPVLFVSGVQERPPCCATQGKARAPLEGAQEWKFSSVRSASSCLTSRSMRANLWTRTSLSFPLSLAHSFFLFLSSSSWGSFWCFGLCGFSRYRFEYKLVKQ